MKTRDFVKLQKKLLPQLSSNFIIRGSYCSLEPVGDVIRGFYFDNSAFSANHFYVSVFFQPLCIPVTRIHLTFGHRIGGRWDSDQEGFEITLLAEMGNELPFLLEMNSPKKVAEALKQLASGGNPHCSEALGYALIQAGEVDRSLEVLTSLLSGLDVSISWQEEIADRARLIISILSNSRQAALQILHMWKTESEMGLGLRPST